MSCAPKESDKFEFHFTPFYGFSYKHTLIHTHTHTHTQGHTRTRIDFPFSISFFLFFFFLAIFALFKALLLTSHVNCLTLTPTKFRTQALKILEKKKMKGNVKTKHSTNFPASEQQWQAASLHTSPPRPLPTIFPFSESFLQPTVC